MSVALARNVGMTAQKKCRERTRGLKLSLERGNDRFGEVGCTPDRRR